MAETSDQNEKLNQAHRFFGIELHNSSYDHLDNAVNNPEEGELALQAAYGSLYHWGKIGTPENFSRGELTIAQIAVKLERPEAALHHAKRCLHLVEQHDLQDWDRAYAYETFARANALVGNREVATKYKGKAHEAAKAIADKGDRDQFESDLNTGKWYGIE